MREDLVLRGSCCCRTGDSGTQILVEEVIGRRIGAGARIVLDVDAFSAGQLAAPLGIEVEAAGDPRTDRILVGALGRISVEVGLRGTRLVILVRVRVVQRVRIEIECVREVLVGVPADELVIIANASDRVDTLARIYTERSLLAAHGEGRVRSGNVGVEEHAVLDLNPLGIDRHAALRHGIEGVCLGACLVDVPAREDVACVWIGFIGV